MTVIAIDGPAGAGKSSVAREVARALGLLYVDTGAMYRAIAVAVLDAGRDPADAGQVGELLQTLRLDASHGVVKVNGEDVQDRIRSSAVTRAAAQVAQHPVVRQALVDMQRDMATSTDVVMEGRDIGTAVFPDAEVKIYLTASLEERARRRLAQVGRPADDGTLREAMRDIERRDESDRTREVSPLKQAADATVVDTTAMSAEEVVAQICSVARAALERGARP